MQIIQSFINVHYYIINIIDINYVIVVMIIDLVK